MTKYKTTDKEQRENNTLIIDFGYCEIQNIERYLRANAYTAGLYGWRADFYEFSGFTISTGYAPLKFMRYKVENSRYAWIKKEILKLEKKLEKRAYKFQQGGDWHKGAKFIKEKINNLYLKSAAHFNEIKD